MFTGSRLVLVAAVLLACEEPPAQDASQTQVTYQNGYAQTTPRASGAQPQAPVTYAPTGTSAPAATATTGTPAATATATAPAPTATTAAPIQTTPVPVGVQALPPPAGATGATSATPSKPAPTVTHKTMAVPGPGAFTCQSDAQCLLGRCNTLYGRCAYPCKNSDIDCKPNNVCTAAGLCMPRAGGGLGM